MPTFIYKYKMNNGKVRKGQMDADSYDEMRARLNRPSIIADSVYIKEKTAMDVQINLPSMEVVTPKDVSIFTRQFSTLLDAAIDLTKSFDILTREMDNKKFKKVLLDIKGKIESGTPISTAMKGYPKLFDDLYINMVGAGEQSGKLPLVFKRLAEYMEKSEEIKGKVKSAMTYPTIIAIVAVVMVFVMMTGVIPQFKSMFAEFGGKLPPPTMFLFNLSEFFKKYSIHMVVVIVGLVVAHLMLQKKSVKYRWILDLVALKVPIAGDITKKNAIARFARTMSTLLDSGVHLPEALMISSKTTGNILYEEAISEARDSVTAGQPLTTPLKEAKIFPGMVVQMIDAGQESGKTSDLLAKVADFYETEVDTAIEGLMAALEPIIMVVLGSVLGFIVIAMFMPILTMSSMVG